MYAFDIIPNQLIHQFESLTPELQKQVIDFVVFLRKQSLPQQVSKRTVGEYRDKIQIADDFSVPLTDDFWIAKKSSFSDV